MLSVRFWGVRGSIPCPGYNTVKFGGNTSCLEIRAGKKLAIVDLGTGSKPLGDWIMKHDYRKGPLDFDIFLSHTHWDHIIGLPMFIPLFIRNATLRIRGPISYNDDSLEATIGNQLSYRFWPVRQSELEANIAYLELNESTIDLGEGLKVSTKYLNHSILCLGYRFEYQGKSIVTLYDHEPFRNLFPTDPKDPTYNEDSAREGEEAAKEGNEKILRFIHKADVLIHDTQYTASEFEEHLGWGHSSFEFAIKTAFTAGVKKLVFFHHDPNRTDAQLQTLTERYQKKLKDKSALEIIMAREGLTVKA